jgi:hypothetical protein
MGVVARRDVLGMGIQRGGRRHARKLQRDGVTETCRIVFGRIAGLFSDIADEENPAFVSVTVPRNYPGNAKFL